MRYFVKTFQSEVVQIFVISRQGLKFDFFCINTDTGFCNYEETADLTYGNYAWTETFGGKTVITKCAFKQDFNVKRKCLPYGDGWGDIDFTGCRSSK